MGRERKTWPIATNKACCEMAFEPCVCVPEATALKQIRSKGRRHVFYQTRYLFWFLDAFGLGRNKILRLHAGVGFAYAGGLLGTVASRMDFNTLSSSAFSS